MEMHYNDYIVIRREQRQQSCHKHCNRTTLQIRAFLESMIFRVKDNVENCSPEVYLAHGIKIKIIR